MNPNCFLIPSDFNEYPEQENTFNALTIIIAKYYCKETQKVIIKFYC